MPHPPLKRFLPLLAALALLGLAATAYSPGLTGPFLLDDWGTLPKLGAYGPVDDPVTFVSYVTDGADIGPSGRPLALASFLIDARDWPARPWPFKLTNLLLHLLNGVLLALLLRQLSRLRGLAERPAAWAGLLGAGLWLVHPLWVSTTLYVVQRMAELSALFVFAGLAAYLHGRRRLAEGRCSGYGWMIAGIGGGAVLGALAKENALLLPVFALALGATVLAAPEAAPWRPPATRGWLAFRAVFLWFPAAAIGAYLLRPLAHATVILPSRGYSLLARLLTEPRVLARYLYYLAIPHAATGGLYTEITPSSGLFHPWTTLPSIALVLGLVAGAWAIRRCWPALAAAILFYFAGQLLESTTIPLELYFEHRNYLPAALAFWPLALWALRGPGGRALRAGVLGLAFAVLLTLTGLRASLWGHEARLAGTWLRLDPGSPRALVWASEIEARHGRPGPALARLRAASTRFPDDLSVAANRLDLACRTGRVRPGDLTAAIRAARRDRVDSNLLYSRLPLLADYLTRHPCPPLNLKDLRRIAAAALANPQFIRYPGIRQTVLMLQGRLALRAGDRTAAYAAFARGLAADPKPAAALVASALLAGAQAPRLGLAILSEYARMKPVRPRWWSMARLHDWWLERTGWYSHSFRRVRAALEVELRRSGA